MKNALSKFNNDDLFNDLHYTNFTHVSIVEHFTHKIKAISEAQSNIHKHLKKEGNKLKVIEKELSSKHKTFSLSKSNKHLSPNKTDNTLIINASKLLHSTRNNMKEAFETYIDSQLAKIDDVPNLTEEDMQYMRHMMLIMYANPLKNQIAVNS